jgi:hypothetical protein
MNHPKTLDSGFHGILSMTYRICSCTRVSSSFQAFIIAIRVASLAVIMLTLPRYAAAFVADEKGQTIGKPCAFSDAPFDTTTDVRALDKYHDAIAQLLKQEQFLELDCMADAAREKKTRFPGGAWKLHHIYLGLESPRPGHPTEEDWRLHLDLVERWRCSNPHSVTAPIVLAESYVGYAWSARGDGFGDSVSESGWKLFGERNIKAKAILDENSAPASKCPEWYIAMHEVAQGQSWGLDRDTALFQQAVAFEPSYQYFYQVHASYLLPKWTGEAGDTARFAEQSANRVGGEAGDELYFEIGAEILCGCEEPEFDHFSWPRLQKGFAGLEKKRGVSLYHVNSFALMAAKSQDWVAADAAFKRIGDNWSEDRWGTLELFRQNRDAAAQVAPLQIRARADRKEAQDNMQTAEGKAYRKEMEPKLAAFEESCLKESNADPQKTELFLRIGKNGEAENAETQQRPGTFAVCMMRAFYLSFTRKETPFTPPPHAAYWVVLELDPATLAASAK